MSLLKEQFRSMYRGMSISCSPETFRRNTKFLMSKHDLPKGQAMAAAYAVLAWSCERTAAKVRAGDVKESNPLVIKSFLKPDELAEAEGLVQMLREEPLTESFEPKKFTGVYDVTLSYLPERWNSNLGDNLPESWEARVDKVEFRRGTESAFESDAPMTRGIFGQGSTWLEAVGVLKRDMEKAGYRGMLRVQHSDGKSDTIVLAPQRRLTEERAMDELSEISEIEALVKKGSLSEQQRPAVGEFVKHVEDDLKKGILVSLARVMREMGYERWPHDNEGREDIKNVTEALAKEMVKMGRRFNQLMRDQLRVLRTRGPQQYERIIRRWLQGQPEGAEHTSTGTLGRNTTGEPDGEKGKDTTSPQRGDLKKVAEGGDVQFEPIDKDVWNGMSVDERMDYLDEVGLIDPEDAKARDIAGSDWAAMESKHPETMKAILKKMDDCVANDDDVEKKDEPKDEPEKKAEPAPVTEAKKKVTR